MGHRASSGGAERPLIPQSGLEEVNVKEGHLSLFLRHLLALLALFLLEETAQCFAGG